MLDWDTLAPHLQTIVSAFSRCCTISYDLDMLWQHGGQPVPCNQAAVPHGIWRSFDPGSRRATGHQVFIAFECVREHALQTNKRLYRKHSLKVYSLSACQSYQSYLLVHRHQWKMLCLPTHSVPSVLLTKRHASHFTHHMSSRHIATYVSKWTVWKQTNHTWG